MPVKRVTRPPVKQLQIVRHIRGRILSGKLSPGQRLPTRSEIEKQFNVSSLTGQRAFSHLLNDGFVVARGRSGTFVSDYPPHLYHAAIIFPSKSNAKFEVQYIRVIRQLARRLDGWRNWRVSIYDLTKPEDRETLDDDIQGHRLAGAVFAWSPHDIADLPVARAPWLTRIALTRNCPFAASIEFNYMAFIERAAKFLAEQGCKRVSTIAPGLYMQDIQDRRDYYAKLGLATDNYLFQSGHPTDGRWARNQAELIMRLPPDLRPDGIIVGDDNLYHPLCEGIRAVLPESEAPRIVTHCNFPDDDEPILPTTFLGFDLEFIMRHCLLWLEDARDGVAPPRRAEFLPRLADETPDADDLLIKR